MIPCGQFLVLVRQWIMWMKPSQKLWGQNLYHLESRWPNSHVWVYNGPLLSHLLGVAAIYFHYGVSRSTIIYDLMFFWGQFLQILRPSNKLQRHIGSLKFFWKIWNPAVEIFKLLFEPPIYFPYDWPNPKLLQRLSSIVVMESSI